VDENSQTEIHSVAWHKQLILVMVCLMFGVQVNATLKNYLFCMVVGGNICCLIYGTKHRYGTGTVTGFFTDANASFQEFVTFASKAMVCTVESGTVQ
jgi:hypothetical protein